MRFGLPPAPEEQYTNWNPDAESAPAVPEPIPEAPAAPPVVRQPSPADLAQTADAVRAETEPALPPDFIRQIPTAALDAADRQTQADDILARGRKAIADNWLTNVALPNLRDRAEAALTEGFQAVGRITGADQEPTDTGDTLSVPSPGVTDPGTYIRNFLAQPRGERSSGDVITEALATPANLARALMQATEPPDEARTGVSDLLRGVNEQGLAMLLGGPARVPGMGKWGAAAEIDPLLAAFNRAPELGPGLAERASGFMGAAERLISDRWAAINKVGPETEALMSTFAGRTEGAFQRAADELGPVYAAITDDLPQLNKYVGLQTYIENAAAKLNPTRQGVGGIGSVADAQAQLAQMEADLGPALWKKVQDADALRTDAMRNLLQDKVDAGLIPEQLAERLNQQLPHYNPTIITKYLEEAAAGRGGSTLRQMTNTLKRLTEEGSTEGQLPPMQAALKHMMDSDLAIRRNTLVNSLVEEGGFAAKPVVSLTTGVNIAPEAEGALATVANKTARFIDQGKAYFMRDGRLMEAAIPQDIADAIGKMSTEHLNAAEQIFMGLNRSLRVGATTINPGFFVPNMVRDYAMAFIREGLLPQQEAAMFIDALTHGPTWRQYMRAGGGFGEGGSYFAAPTKAKGLADIEERVRSAGGTMLSKPQDIAEFVDAIGRRDLTSMAKFFVNPKLPVDRMIDVGKAVEQAPHLAAFAQHLGAGETEAAAGMAGRRATVDFARAGELTRLMNVYTPFLNARVQGALQAGRGLRDNPATAFRAALLGTAGVGAYLWNRQFPGFADVPDYLRENGFATFMLPGAEENPNGLGFSKNPFATIPLGEWGAITTGVDEVMRGLDGKSKGVVDALGKIANNINPLPGSGGIAGQALALMPVTAPGRALFEAQSNYDFFRDRPIETESMRNLLPELRYTPRTSELAKRIANTLADKPVPDEFKSPTMIEHIVNSTLGGAGRLGMQAVSTGILGQPSDKPAVVGGMLSTVYRDYGGQVENQAYQDRDAALSELQDKYRPLIRTYEENTGSGSLSNVPTKIGGGGGVPLLPADQAAYQAVRLATLQHIFESENVDKDLAPLAVEDRRKVLSHILGSADKVAVATVLEAMGEAEIEQRMTGRREPNKNRSLPLPEYTPMSGNP